MKYVFYFRKYVEADDMESALQECKDMLDDCSFNYREEGSIWITKAGENEDASNP